MSAKAGIITMRVEPKLKHEASELFGRLGLSVSDALRLFLVQSVERKALPFSVEITNKTTLAAIAAVERGEYGPAMTIEGIEALWRKNERNPPSKKLSKRH